LKSKISGKSLENILDETVTSKLEKIGLKKGRTTNGMEIQ
jgi:hypothetical protein